jgi:hypothetical protein
MNAIRIHECDGPEETMSQGIRGVLAPVVTEETKN